MIFIRKNKMLIVSGIVVLALSGFFLTRSGFNVKSVPAYSVQRQDYIPSLLLSGEIIPESNLVLSLQTTGVVQHVFVEKGKQVKKGQIILQIDDQQARLALEQAKGAVEIARLNLQKAETAVNLEGARLNSVEMDLAAEQAQRNFERTKSLATTGAISQQELELAEQTLKLSQERARSAKVSFESLKNNEGVSLTLLQKELQQRQLDLSNQEFLLEQFKVIAPEDGQIIELFADQGELLQAGSKVARISSSQRSRVQIKPDQRYADLASVNNPAQLWIPTKPDIKWPAKVVFTEPSGNTDQGSLTAELSLEEKVPDLYPGRLVSVQLFSALEKQAIIVEDAYLTTNDGKSGVWIAKLGLADFVPLQTGLRTSAGVVILSGLNEGDLILEPANLRVGQKVAPQLKGIDTHAK